MEMIPFDLQRIFIGEHPPLFLLEIIFRTIIMYGYTIFAARFMGKRGMGQITPFEFVVIISIGSAVGDPMFYDDVPLTYGILVVTIIVIMQRLLNALTNASPSVEEVVEGKTIQIIDNGKVIEAALRAEEMSMEELCMQLRQKDIKNIGAVEKAYLEPSGSLSVFTYEKGQERKGVSTLPT